MGNLLTENIPEFVEVRLIQEDSSGRRRAVETIQLSAANAWKHTFDNLPSKGLVNGEIMSFTYSVEEISTPLGFTTRYETSEIPGRIQIVNQLSPIEIPVQKIWDDGENQDGVRPSSIIVRLVANDEITDQTLVLEEENDWKDSFIGLYAYRDELRHQHGCHAFMETYSSFGRLTETYHLLSLLVKFHLNSILKYRSVPPKFQGFLEPL